MSLPLYYAGQKKVEVFMSLLLMNYGGQKRVVTKCFQVLAVTGDTKDPHSNPCSNEYLTFIQVE